MEPVVFLLVIVGVLCLAACGFVLWLVWKALVITAWLLLLPFRLLAKAAKPRPKPMPTIASSGRCVRDDCNAFCPAGARFCPRCGAALVAGTMAGMREAEHFRNVTTYHYPARERLPVYA